MPYPPPSLFAVYSIPQPDGIPKYCVKFSRYYLKAFDPNIICISFSDGLIIMTKADIEKMVKPERPKTLENPIDKCKKDAKRYEQIIQKTGKRELVIGHSNLLSTKENEKHREDIKDNNLNIWDISLIHTREESSNEYYLIPMGRGEYKASISAICEELVEDVIQEFEIIVE